jgi:tetratricopeptide (TPR) repeat protein
VDSLSIPLAAAERKALQKDVPASPKAYETYLRANQASRRHSGLQEARDLYLSCLKEDPRYAPAWARLGRAYRVMAKYGYGDGAENLKRAEEAFRRALEINPDLSAAHNLFTYFEIEEIRRPKDAMVRLLGRARTRTADPELFAGLVVACRFCGLLDASLAADRRAHRLDPMIRTSVPYTLWMLGEHEEAMRRDDEEPSWIRLHALPLVGRGAEAVEIARAIEKQEIPATTRAMVVMMRAAIERRAEEAAQAARLVFASNFHDPEGLLHGARALAWAGDADLAIEMLRRSTDGRLCAPLVLRRDPWLEPLRGRPEFAECLERMDAGRSEAAKAYQEAGGERLLGVAAG